MIGDQRQGPKFREDNIAELYDQAIWLENLEVEHEE
jgi:hypothetical protein